MSTEIITPGGYDGYCDGRPLAPITVSGCSESIDWLKRSLGSNIQYRRTGSWAADQLAIVAAMATDRGGNALAEEIARVRNALLSPSTASRAQIVCLVGSSRFYQAFMRAAYELELAGKIVVGPGFCPDVAPDQHGGNVGITPEQKRAVDLLYKQKIAVADEVFVLNVGGYVGSSTREDIAFAVQIGKPIRWLEPNVNQVPT